MEKNGFRRIFCILFFALCAIPLAVFLLAGPSAPGANERPAAKPRVISAGRVNWDVLSDAADYFADTFGLRQELITADAQLQAVVLHQSAVDDVLLGADGWLYYADTLRDYTGSEPITERELWCAARNLYLVQEYAAAHGAQFLFVCAPNKNTLYPDAMPARYIRAEGASDLDRLLAALDAQQVAYCDVRGALLGADALTYYRTDSHWNGYGSALAHDEILRALGREGTLASEAFSVQGHTGDLYQMLYPASKRQEEGLNLARARTFSYGGDVRGADDQLIRTTSTAAGRLLLFRDSFGNALHEDLAESFGAATFSRAMPYDLSLLDDAQPDVLAVELVERNLRWLCTRPPELPAPTREIAAEDAALSDQTIELTKTASDWDGLVRYTATLDSVSLDATSPIYVLLNGTTYEACPTDTGFSLLAPEAETAEVLFQTNSTLTRCRTEIKPA